MITDIDIDEKYMSIALSLSLKGKGHVSPNPIVGALIVKDNVIIGEGYHEKYGEAHAEINAFKNAVEDVKGSTMYVTLEPCSHYGKTPPCAEEIIKKKINRVVIGTLDTNTLVSGRGVKMLKEAGIEVEVGVLEEECMKANEVFMKYIINKEPFVVMKSAMSLDGKIATATGKSKWITGEKARKKVHLLRKELTAIMVGVNTVINDNPELTCRIEGGVNPIRIIVDSNIRIPLESKVLQTAKNIKTIIATTEKVDKHKVKLIEGLGAQVIKVKSKGGRVDLKKLMKILGEEKIDSILLEGGGNLNFSALNEGIVDKVQIYIAPKIIGGEKAKGVVLGSGIQDLKDAFLIDEVTYRNIGEDILIEGYIKKGDTECLQE